MPQRCTVCSHPETKAIEQEIIQGLPNTTIAASYGLDHQAIRYHSIHHLPEKLTRAVKHKEEKHAENMLEGIKDLLDRTKRILDDAEDKNQKTLALKAIKEARGTYELLSKIAVKLEDYRRADQKKENKAAARHATKGLQSLSDKELELFIQLQAKIAANEPDYQFDPETRMFVDTVGQIWPANDADATRSYDAGDSNSPSNRLSQVKNSQKNIDDDADDLLLDDLNDFDLDLDKDDDTIPSEETDPAWLVRYRNR